MYKIHFPKHFFRPCLLLFRFFLIKKLLDFFYSKKETWERNYFYFSEDRLLQIKIKKSSLHLEKE